MRENVIISWLLALIVGLLPATLNASTIEIDSIRYNNVDNHAEVIGFVAGLTSAIIVPEVEIDGATYPVTVINDNAFKACATLTELILPETISIIRSSAFRRCSGLKSVTIPNSVVSIGNSAFANSGLTRLFFNAEKCTVCGDYDYHAFPSGLSEVVIGENVKIIPDYFLMENSKLEDVVIPNSVVEIGDYAFSGCSKLASVKLSDSLGIIGDSAFSYCDILSSITIPKSVTGLGHHPFYCCDNLQTLVFNAENCENLSFWEYDSLFPSSVSNLTIGETVKKIPVRFLTGSEIVKLKIPNSVTTIEGSAFTGADSLKELEMGNSVTTIGTDAFSLCGFAEVVIPNSVTSIGEYAFSRCKSLSTVAMPESLENLENNVFEGCESLVSITLPMTIKTMGYSVFSGCTALENIVLHDDIISIGSCAFSDCVSLKSVSLPKNLSEISSWLFKGCTSLVSIDIPNKITIIRDRAFENCSSLVEVQLPANVSEISLEAFSGCTSLGNIILPDMINKIGEGAFRNCSQFNNILIPDNVTEIGKEAFNGCKMLETIEFNAVECESSGAFPTSVKNLIIGNKVKKIPPFLLSDGSLIEQLIIPNSVTSIGESAFKNCKKLKSLTMGSGIAQISSGAFSNCSIAKIFWLGNTPPDRYVSARVNYVSNDKFKFDNQKVLPFLSSRFTVDGVTYVLTSPSERTCEIVDCIYSPEYSDCVVDSVVVNKGIELKVDGINAYSFYGNEYIDNLNFKSCKFIDDSALEGCSSIHVVEIPDNTTSLGQSVFLGCTSLVNVYIGKGVTRLGHHLFSGCTGLESINVPGNVGYVDDYAFENCRSLTNVVFEDSDKLLFLGSNEDNPLFNDCPLEKVYIGRALYYRVALGYEKYFSPFCNNKHLQYVEISDRETEIYVSEFYGCSSLKSVKIGDGVTKIGEYAFSGCSSLDYFSVGTHVESIGEEAFSDCVGLTKFYSYSAVPPACGSQDLDDINKWECTLYVPEESKNAYSSAPQWKEFFFMEDVTTEVEGIIPNENKPIEIYTISGVCVKKDAVKDDIMRLEPGVYIIGGKKVVKR